MKKNMFIAVLLCALLSMPAAYSNPLLAPRVFGMQTPAPGLANLSFGISPTYVLANCPANVVGTAGQYTNFCHTGDGKEYECLSTVSTCGTSTAGWTCIAGPGCTASTAGVQTVNGVAPGSTGNVTVSCTGTSPSFAANFSNGGVAGQNLTISCKGTGS